jgi:hypothetical protein
MKRVSRSRSSRCVSRRPASRRPFFELLEDRVPPGDLFHLFNGAELLALPNPLGNAFPVQADAANLSLMAGPAPAPERMADLFPTRAEAAASVNTALPEQDAPKPDFAASPEWEAFWSADPRGASSELVSLLAAASTTPADHAAAGPTGQAVGGLTDTTSGTGPAGGSLSQATLEAMAGAAQGASPRAGNFVPPPPAPSGPPSGPTATLVADTDRDGVVTDADLAGRDQYTSTRGAIFSVNFDDDNRDGNPDAVNFNDAGVPFNENRVIENAADAQDLAPLVIKALGPAFTPDMRVVLSAGSVEDAQSIHVFPSLTPGTTAILGSLGTRIGGAAAATSVDITSFVSATQDVTFGVEGMFFRNLSANPLLAFDGQIDLSVQVFQGPTLISQDAVRMKVAPWLMLPHTQESLQIWARNAGAINASYLFTSAAAPGYYGLDYSGQLNTVTTGFGTQWFQDHVEIGYTQRPGGPATQMVFRLPYFRGTGSVQPAWPQVQLLGPNVGTFQLGINLGAGSGDYGGNVEILPPTAANPLGRIIHGDTGSPTLFNFFGSQEAQPPIQIPTRWLAVGHTDEIIGFTSTPNRLVIADAQTAYDQLEAIPPDKRGESVFFATGRFPQTGTSTSSGTLTRIFTGMDLRGQNWQYLRIYDSAGSGSGAAGQVAHIAPGGLGNGFIDIDTVWNTTSKIVDPAGTSAPSAMRWALVTNAPRQNRWFNIPQAGDQFVLVEGTRFWLDPTTGLDGTPAFVTAAEVLADDELRNLNLIDVQNTLNTVRSTLDNAAGGPGTLTFLKVPVIYFGRRTGFATNRLGVAFTAGLQNFQPLGNEYYVPQQFGPRSDSGVLSGPITLATNDPDESPFTFTVTGALNEGPLTVTELTPTDSGFVATFNRPIDRSTLNLYDTQTGGPGAADVTVTGLNTGPVAGSLAVDAAGTHLTFVRTGGALPADTYNLTFRSAADGFKDTGGGLLDGNRDGTPGDNYTFTFAVTSPPAVTVSVPDFMRGPGQAVSVPAGAGSGIPLRLSDGAGVTSIQLTLRYDPSLLRVTGATLGSGLPAGATLTVGTGTPGIAVLTFRSTTPLGAGPVTFASLTATVPETAAYGSVDVLDLTNLAVNNGAVAVRDDDAVHVVGYFGDTSGNGTLNSIDAQRALRVAVGLDTGFAAYPTADPVVIADVTGNGILNAIDATRILQEAVGIDQAEIPPIPTITPPTGPDIQVLDGGTDIRDNGNVDLGNTPLGAVVTHTFTIRNNGTTPLTLGRVSVPYGYILVAGPGVTTLAPGQQTTFTVRMNTDGIDMLESAANDLVSGVRFVDCWNLYHRLLGEVHCGSIVMRTPFAFGWWGAA